jgi:ribosome-associated heat shock protein Hsp15
MRIDKLLWFLRLTKTRSLSQALVAQGHIRLNRKRVERAAQGVAVGDVLVLPLARGVTTIEIVALPVRRGTAADALSCYRVLDERAANPIAAQDNNSPMGTSKP